MSGDKKVYGASVKLSRVDRETVEALAFSDDRPFTYVLRRAVQEGVKVLQKQGVAPKRPAPK